MKLISGKLLFLFIAFFILSGVNAQRRLPLPSEGARMDSVMNRGSNTSTGPKDSIGFERRNDAKDSLVMSYRFLDSTNRYTLDSSINDYDTYFPIPSRYTYLGNTGSAAFPLIYQPNIKAGFDPGFHAYDIYRLRIEETKIYRTNRPFSMMGYHIASAKEQILMATHVQNPRPNIGFGFDYRLITAPGVFVTQNTNHNNIRLYGNYQGKRKRYQGTIVLVNNNNKASENGGIVDDELLSNPNNIERYTIPVKLGNALAYLPNAFNTKVSTGNIYRELDVMLRQSYDVGKRDSLAVNDSTTEYLFYPRLRFQHTVRFKNSSFKFTDAAPDSIYYKTFYNLDIPNQTRNIDTLNFIDKWQVLSNDFSLLTFPDTKNSAQFFLAGITAQHLLGNFSPGSKATFFNAMAHAEYRNRTRNKLWEILGSGELYVAGFNAGDYMATASLSRYLNAKLGNVKIHFTNTNRTPGFVFDGRSAFYLSPSAFDYKKENIISFGATAQNKLFTLSFKNSLITNLAYFENYYTPAQYSKIINLLQLSGSTVLPIGKSWKWYIDGTFQQTDNASPIQVPLVFLRSRFAFERVLFKNLNLSTGIEARYYTPYNAYDYSPVTGQFIPQKDLQINNRPDVGAYVHFRIKSFSAFIRGDNINTFDPAYGFNFTRNNFSALHYPTPGFTFRLGIRWWFVN